MPTLVFDPPFIKRSISMTEEMHAAIAMVAIEDRHGNQSRVVQDAIRDMLDRRYGTDWHIRVAEFIEAQGVMA